ncbi:MAG TPA: 50S ribosomal protein L18 [Pseudomonadales bacterium]
MNEKKVSRLRRAKKARFKMRELGSHRLSVYRTPQHIYAQVTSPDGSIVIASASTNEKNISVDKKGNCDAAALIGKTIAERALKAGVEQVAFDRSGFMYHGRVKALADAAREGGLRF